MIVVSKVDLQRFAAWGIVEIEDAIVRAVEARREQRRFKQKLVGREAELELDPDALASLARVLQRQGLRSVHQLGEAATAVWARRVGIDLGS